MPDLTFPTVNNERRHWHPKKYLTLVIELTKPLLFHWCRSRVWREIDQESNWITDRSEQVKKSKKECNERGADNRPSDPEGEGGAEDLIGEDGEDSGEEAKEEGGADLEEDGLGEAEREGDGVGHHVRRDGPHPQPLCQPSERPESRLGTKPLPPASSNQQQHRPRHRSQPDPPLPHPPTSLSSVSTGRRWRKRAKIINISRTPEFFSAYPFVRTIVSPPCFNKVQVDHR